MTVVLAPADAQVYWMSAKIPNDAFLLYAFDGDAGDGAVDEILGRARGCPDLEMRVDDGCALTYPAWVHRDVSRDQVVLHGGAAGWQQCLDAVAKLADQQLDLRSAGWRLHVFNPVPGVPGSTGLSTVAVVQVGHALADGVRSSAMAAVLFGRAASVPGVQRCRRGCLLTRSVAAARAQTQLEADTAAGLVPPPAPQRPVLSINNRPDGDRTVRTLVRARHELSGTTVTVAVLAAISDALSSYLTARGENVSMLGAEVPMAKGAVRLTNNHFGNVGVGLYPDLALDERVRRISTDLDERRRRGVHPAFAAGSRSFASVPAPLLRWGVKQFDQNARSPVITGNTVVSSVNRGAVDLTFGGRPVLLTAGYPALSPMMGLTHGVHGIGGTIAVSVHTVASAIADVDEYVERLSAALHQKR